MSWRGMTTSLPCSCLRVIVGHARTSFSDHYPFLQVCSLCAHLLVGPTHLHKTRSVQKQLLAECCSQSVHEQAHGCLGRPPARIAHRVHLDNVETHELSFLRDPLEQPVDFAEIQPVGF